MRDQIFANQKRLGVIPANTELTPWPDDLREMGHHCPSTQKKLFARQAEVFAAYAAYTDNEIGRVIQAVEDMGKLDNTLIIYISAATTAPAPEGSTLGTRPTNRRPTTAFSNMPVAEQTLNSTTPGAPTDLPAHGGGVVLGLRHAVQMDQAGRLALRRHAAGHGDLVARPTSRTPVASAPSSTT